jgi:hypothetical protein
MIYYAKQLYAIELKTEKGLLTKAQEEFLEHLENQGALVEVTYGLDDALRVLEDWGLVNGKIQ